MSVVVDRTVATVCCNDPKTQKMVIPVGSTEVVTSSELPPDVVEDEGLKDDTTMGLTVWNAAVRDFIPVLTDTTSKSINLGEEKGGTTQVAVLEFRKSADTVAILPKLHWRGGSGSTPITVMIVPPSVYPSDGDSVTAAGGTNWKLRLGLSMPSTEKATTAAVDLGDKQRMELELRISAATTERRVPKLHQLKLEASSLVPDTVTHDPPRVEAEVGVMAKTDLEKEKANAASPERVPPLSFVTRTDTVPGNLAGEVQRREDELK